MEKNILLKTFGGLSIMFSVFLLMAVATNYGMAVDGAKYAIGQNGQYRQTSLVQPGRTLPPCNVIEGIFDINKDGEYQTTGDKNGSPVIHHYRAIHADRIKSDNKKPALKLQICNDNKKSWKATGITRVDKENGDVYFLLKSQEDATVTLNDFYTGTYQLIFE